MQNRQGSGGFEIIASSTSPVDCEFESLLIGDRVLVLDTCFAIPFNLEPFWARPIPSFEFVAGKRQCSKLFLKAYL